MTDLLARLKGVTPCGDGWTVAASGIAAEGRAWARHRRDRRLHGGARVDRRSLKGGKDEVRQSELKPALKLDKSAISRRVADALDGGFLKNLEDRKGRPARLTLGDALPDNFEVLPAPEQLVADDGLRGCAVDPGDKAPPPRSGIDHEINSLETPLGETPASRSWEARL